MSFGGTIKLTGEQEYKKALENIRRELREVGAQMKLAAEQYKSGSDAMGAMNTKAKLLEDTLRLQEKKVSTLKDKQKELNEVFAKSAKTHEDLVKRYEEENNKLKGIEKTLGVSSGEYKNQKAVVEDLGVALKKSAQEQEKNEKSMSGLRTELTKAETEYQKTKNAVSDLEGEMKKSSDETKKAESAYGRLKSVISDQEEKLKGLKTEYKNVVISQGENSEAAKKLSGKISDLSGELKQNKDKMRDAETAADKLDKSLGDVGKTAGDAAKGGFTALKVAMGNLVSQGISKLYGAVKDKLGDAIWRVDTVTSFVKTMENLGYSSEETADSINKLKAAAKGMPTTLPALAESQGQFAALIGEMGKATDLTVALSYATLAGSKSQEEANRAMDQWYQIIANGKPDLTSWRIINKAMPAQLNQIADSVLGAGKKSQDLFEAWKNGAVTTEQITDALIYLGKSGAGGLESFEKQARDSTSGIKTSMENIKNAVSIGLSDVIETIGSENITAGLNKVRDATAGAFKVLSDGIKFALDHKTEFAAAFAGIGTAILAIPFGPVGAGIAGIVGALTLLWDKSEKFKNFWVDLWGRVKEATISGIDASVKSVSIAWDNVSRLWWQAKDTFLKICDAISQAGKISGEAVANWFAQSIGKVKAIWGTAQTFFKGVWDSIKGVFSSTGEFFGAVFKAANDKMKGVVSTWNAYFDGVWGRIKNTFGPVKSWFGEAFRGAADAVKNAFSGLSDFFGGVWNGIKSKFSSIGTSIADAIGGSVRAGLNSVIRMIENTINGAIGLINGAIGLINQIPGVSIGKIGNLNLPRLARGGVLDDGARLVYAGEDGAEAIVPLERNTEWIKKVANELKNSYPRTSPGPVSGDVEFKEIVAAFKTALKEVKVELDGEEAGKFVERTVTRAIYT